LTPGLRLEELNALPDDAAVACFLRCCGSMRWARLMAGKRPFPSIAQAVGQADRVWASLCVEDWLEAFAAHPRIGDSGTGAPAGDMPGALTRGASEGTRLEWSPGAGEKKIAVTEMADWSLVEQAQVSSAGPDVRDRLAAANREYEARFGYIFIVCATGKSAEEMLALLERRMTHSPGDELAVAVEEQRKITRLRLGKLLVA
jgi:2-oxo-4-hydroxy-4-carboxy-5-ureidoimidazoline decarboxylase